jgi:pimeloyl-ACP methyl ester carboxylesterase
VEFETIEGGAQRYVVSRRGEGPDVVLFHGFPDTPYSWREIEEALVGAGWRVTVPWLRGYRQETIVAGRRYDPQTLGRDGLGLLDALDVQSAVLVGHDWGALISYVVAALAPERIRAIVTAGIPHPAVLERTPAAFWAVRHFLGLKLPWAPWVCRRNDFAYLDKLCRRWSPSWSGSERDETLRLAKQALSPPATLDGAISYYRDLPLGSPPPVTAHVPKVRGLVIGGAEDLADVALYKRTAELLEQPSRALIVEGAGHWPHREDPALVVPALLEFLGEVGA